MPNKDTDSRLIYHHLSEIDRLADERERLDAQVREVNVAWHHHVAAVEPHLARLGGAAVNVYNRVIWLDPVHGIRVKKLRPWIALVPDVEPEPIRPACDNCGNTTTDCGGHARCLKCGNSMTTAKPVIVPAPETAKPMSYGEMMATRRYVPDPIDTDKRIDDVRRRLQAEAAALTESQIDEGSEPESITPEMETAAARRMAFESALMLPDGDLEAIAEAWDRDEDSDLHAVRTLDGHTYIGNGSAP